MSAFHNIRLWSLPVFNLQCTVRAIYHCHPFDTTVTSNRCGNVQITSRACYAIQLIFIDIQFVLPPRPVLSQLINCENRIRVRVMSYINTFVRTDSLRAVDKMAKSPMFTWFSWRGQISIKRSNIMLNFGT